MIKGAPVTPEASTISGASATTEVQNNSAEVQNNSASASDPVDAEAPAKILIPLEHWSQWVIFGLLLLPGKFSSQKPLEAIEACQYR